MSIRKDYNIITSDSEVTKESIIQSVKNWLDEPNNSTYYNRPLIKLYLNNKEEFYKLIHKVTKKYKHILTKFKLPLAKSEFNLINSIENDSLRHCLFMMLYKYDPVTECVNMFNYIKNNQTEFPVLYKTVTKYKLETENLINQIISFTNIISCKDNEDDYLILISKEDDKRIKILYIFEDTEAALLKLPGDDGTYSRKWGNSSNSGDINFTNFDTCLAKKSENEYLMAPGRFKVIKCVKDDENYRMWLKRE